MNMMEDIKIKLKDSEFVAVDFTVEEVQYLLSKLEIATQALEQISGKSSGFSPDIYKSMVLKWSQEALQQIRS